MFKSFRDDFDEMAYFLNSLERKGLELDNVVIFYHVKEENKER